MISKDQFRRAVVQGIKQVKGMDDVDIADSDDFSTAGLDSLDSMNLVLEVESITGLNFGEFNLSDANNIDDFYKKAEQLSGK